MFLGVGFKGQATQKLFASVSWRRRAALASLDPPVQIRFKLHFRNSLSIPANDHFS
jgi:uncharacterized protein YhjY with autotransporter beta-barrel domain